jgi:hypothetical protein
MSNWFPKRIRLDKQANVWVAKAGSILTQGTTIIEAWKALRSAVNILRRIKRKRSQV